MVLPPVFVLFNDATKKTYLMRAILLFCAYGYRAVEVCYAPKHTASEILAKNVTAKYLNDSVTLFGGWCRELHGNELNLRNTLPRRINRCGREIPCAPCLESAFVARLYQKVSISTILLIRLHCLLFSPSKLLFR